MGVRGIQSKLACIREILSELKPDICLLTETHLNENKGINVPGYAFCGRARNEGKGGGVGIFVKSEKRLLVAPHYSNRDLEILWVSIDRKNQKPLYVGVYYGKQETTCKEKINEEMENLTEELLEIQNEGEVIICMDANAKTGLLGENKSGNGKLIEEAFDECGMYVMN